MFSSPRCSSSIPIAFDSRTARPWLYGRRGERCGRGFAGGRRLKPHRTRGGGFARDVDDAAVALRPDGATAALRADSAVKLLGLGRAASRQPAGAAEQAAGTSQQAEVISYFLNCNIEYDVCVSECLIYDTI